MNEIGHLLNEDGFYSVPKTRTRFFTCYKCFDKFKSSEDLEAHKLVHDEDSEDDEEEDSEIEISSESDTQDIEQPIQTSNRTFKEKQTDDSLKTSNSLTRIRIPSLKFPKISVRPAVELRAEKKPSSIAPTHIASTSVESSLLEGKSLPAINNIQIKCLNCDLMFNNSIQLMEHKPLESVKTCSFKCKVCSKGYSTPLSYMEHIMQHNSFIPKRPTVTPKTVSSTSMNLPNAFKYICVSCNSRFEDCYQLRRHEITIHNKKEQQVYQSEKQKPKIVVLRDLYPSLPQKDTENDVINEPNQSRETNTAQHIINSEGIDKIDKETEDNPINQQESDLDAELRGTKRRSSIFSADANERKEKLLKIISKRSKRPKEPKSAAKTNGTSRTRTKKNVEEETTDIVSNLENPVTEASESGIKKERLTCDICFDVFEEINSFEEHMEFHNDLELKFSDNIAPDVSKNVIEKAAISDDDVEIVENVDITLSTEDTPKKQIDKSVNTHSQKKIKDNTTEMNVEGTDDSEDCLTIDEGPVGPKEMPNAANCKIKYPRDCPDCKMNFRRHRSLRAHIAKKIYCPICKYSSCKLPSARSHILKEHQLHFCGRCKGNFGTVDLLKEHYKKDHTCNQCQKIVTSLLGHSC